MILRWSPSMSVGESPYVFASFVRVWRPRAPVESIPPPVGGVSYLLLLGVGV